MSGISSTQSTRSNHMQNRSQINLHILIRCQWRRRCMQTFNGLSSAVPRVQKLNKYLSHKYMGTYIGALADSEELFSFQVAHIRSSSSFFFPLPRRTWTRLSEAFTSLVVHGFIPGRLTVQALNEREYFIFLGC